VSESPPTFSVVLPAYNTASTIRDAVESVLGQTCQEFELVVVDDGSTDGTADVLNTFDDHRLRVIRQENRGAAAARNVGIAASSGRLVSFLDSDDLWMPSYLEAMRRLFADEPEVVLGYTDAWVIDPEHRRVGTATAMHWQRPPIPPPASSERLLLELLERNFIYAAATIRRDSLERLGPLDERLGAAVDYELWLRVVAHGYRIARPAGLHAIYRKGRVGSISSNRVRVWQNLSEVYRIVAEEYEISPVARAKARARLASARREVAALEGTAGLLGGMWRTRARPTIVAGRNALFRRNRWHAVPPRELAEAFPSLVGAQLPRR
jgi:glycosyltransferase involved in cell wall biosynthesis